MIGTCRGWPLGPLVVEGAVPETNDYLRHECCPERRGRLVSSQARVLRRLGPTRSAVRWHAPFASPATCRAARPQPRSALLLGRLGALLLRRRALGAAVGLALLLAGLGVHERGNPPAGVVGLAGRLLGNRVADALGLGGLLRRLSGLRVRSRAEQQ